MGVGLGGIGVGVGEGGGVGLVVGVCVGKGVLVGGGTVEVDVAGGGVPVARARLGVSGGAPQQVSPNSMSISVWISSIRLMHSPPFLAIALECHLLPSPSHPRRRHQPPSLISRVY